MAGAPPPLPSSRPKGAYVPPPLPSNRPKVAYVHPLPPTTPEPTQEDVHMKPGQQQPTPVINMDEQDAASSSLGRQLQAALHDRMMNNLNDLSGKPDPPAMQGGVAQMRPIPSQRPEISHKLTPTPKPNPRPLSYSSFGDLFGGSTNKQQQPASLSNQNSHTTSSSSSSSSSTFNQLSGLFGSSSASTSSSTGTDITLTATSDQKKAAANYSWNVAKDASKNISAKDVFSVGGLFASAYSKNGKVNASQEQQAALGRISGQVGQSAARNVTAEELGHAANFATTNVVNNATAKVEPSNQPQSSFDLLAQVMGSKGGGLPPSSQNPAARARPKPLQQNAPSQPNLASGLPPPPSPTPRQKVAPQPQRVAPQPTQLVPPRAAPKAPPSKAKSQGGSSLIDFDVTEPVKSGPPGLPKSKAQGAVGGRTKPTIIRPNAGGGSRSASPAVEQQQKKSKPPPRPVVGPPSKKMAPARPNAIQGTRSAGSTPPKPSGLQPKRKAPPRPGSQKGKKMAPKVPGGGPGGGGGTKKLPPRPGPGHPLYNRYMGSEPHAVALFDYQGQEADELSFKADDVIILVKRIDADWLVGKCKNKEGMFPTQFVKIVKDLNEKKEDDYDGPQAVALFGFQASAVDELSFDEGDIIKLLGTVGTVWFRGEVKGKSGIFPSNHVEVIVPLPGGSPLDDAISGPRCKAKFEYASSSPDDLIFNEGAMIKLTGRVGDEWFSGELDGQSGIFPAAFVDVIEDLPPASSRAISPTTGNEVRAMYDFDGADDTELTFKDGDKIMVTAKVGAEWLEGELNGKKGRFPAAFVDRVPPGLPQATDKATSGVDPHCVVSFDFEPAGDDEIRLKAGEKVTLLERIGDEWLRGKIDSREGIFPRSFVDVIIDLPSAGATPSTAKALHDFDAEDADELSFKAGDVIAITERVNDEWLKGTVSGRSGRFPAAFVELSS